MLDFLARDPKKVVFFSILISLSIVVISFNIKNPKRLFFLLVLYLPVSFKSLSGSLSMYLAILLFLLSCLFGKKNSNSNLFFVENALSYMLLVISLLFVFNDNNLSLLRSIEGRTHLSPSVLIVFTIFSSIFLYKLARKYISSRDDILKFLKFSVFAGAFASIAGYFQLFGLLDHFLIKYVVLAENPKWSKRIAATMPGYELLSEYTIILIGFTLILFILSTEKRFRYLLFVPYFIAILALTEVRGIYIAVVLSIIYIIFFIALLGKFGDSIKLSIYSGLIVIAMGVSVATIIHLRPDSDFSERINKMAEVDIDKGKFDTRTGVWMWGMGTINKMKFSEKIIGAGNKYFIDTFDKKKSAWPHCLYMAIIMRNGIAGLTVYLLFISYVFIKSTHNVILTSRHSERKLFIASLIFNALVVVHIINEVKIEFIRHDRTENFIWLFYAIVICFNNYLINKEKKEKMIPCQLPVTPNNQSPPAKPVV